MNGDDDERGADADEDVVVVVAFVAAFVVVGSAWMDGRFDCSWGAHIIIDRAVAAAGISCFM